MRAPIFIHMACVLYMRMLTGEYEMLAGRARHSVGENGSVQIALKRS